MKVSALAYLITGGLLGSPLPAWDKPSHEERERVREAHREACERLEQESRELTELHEKTIEFLVDTATIREEVETPA